MERILFIVIGVVIALVLILGLMLGLPHYNVWQKEFLFTIIHKTLKENSLRKMSHNVKA